MAAADRAAQQADFDVLSHAFHTVGDEIGKLSNLPAIASGERILTEIQQMSTEIQQMRNETNQQFARLEERIAASHQSLLTTLRTRYISPSIHSVSPY